MNIYEDYESYKLENEELIKLLIVDTPDLNVILHDCITLLDYLLTKVNDKVELDKVEDEIFDIGYGLLSNILEELKIYYKEYFNKDIIQFRYYSHLMFYSFYMDDLISFYEEEGDYDEDAMNLLKEASDNIDHLMVNKEIIDDKLYTELEYIIEEATPTNNEYKPAYIVFGLMCEELGIE